MVQLTMTALLNWVYLFMKLPKMLEGERWNQTWRYFFDRKYGGFLLTDIKTISRTSRQCGSEFNTQILM